MTKGGFTARYETGLLPYGSLVFAQNVIIWLDGTIRPWRGHNDCSGVWVYDGQVFVHKDNSSPKAPKGTADGGDV